MALVHDCGGDRFPGAEFGADHRSHPAACSEPRSRRRAVGVGRDGRIRTAVRGQRPEFGKGQRLSLLPVLDMSEQQSGTTGTKRGLRYLAIWAAFALLPMALVATVNFAVDPFQFFRVSNPPRFSNPCSVISIRG